MGRLSSSTLVAFSDCERHQARLSRGGHSVSDARTELRRMETLTVEAGMTLGKFQLGLPLATPHIHSDSYKSCQVLWGNRWKYVFRCER